MLDIKEIIKTADAMNVSEWQNLCRYLEDHHSMFYKVWEMGKPLFTKSIPTACVTFDKEGSYLYFLFNPDFWAGLDSYNKMFVICHEALHIMLNHGIRFKDSTQRDTANIAMDVVVNHTLTREFGFDRTLVQNWEELCWVDTVFGKNYKHNGIRLGSGETAERYYNLLLAKKNNKKNKSNSGDNGSSQKSSSSGDEDDNSQGQDKSKESGSGSSKVRTLDQHHFGDPNSDGTSGQDSQNIIQKVKESLSEEEQDAVAKSIGKHGNSTNPFAQAGTGHGNQSHNAQIEQIKVKKKWESIIKKWTSRKLEETENTVDQWVKEHRRYVLLPKDLMLPSEMDIETLAYEKSKLDVYFFLDTSGSCWHLKDRFFSIAKTLPKSRFNLKLFCFDTQVIPTDLASCTAYGSGGTCFVAIENYIQQELQSAKVAKKKAKYPEAVWVMTDGYGTKVNPQFPKKWFWLIDHPNGTNEAMAAKTVQDLKKRYLPEESNVFNLMDFV